MNSHHSRKHVWLALSALLLLPTTWVKAQGGASGAPTKLAVMNVREAIIATAEGKVASAQLQAQFASQQNDLGSYAEADAGSAGPFDQRRPHLE